MKKPKGRWIMYGNPMQTLQVRVSSDDLKLIDDLVKKGVYYNRSDLVREGVRRLLDDANK